MKKIEKGDGDKGWEREWGKELRKGNERGKRGKRKKGKGDGDKRRERG
jgi:hypothetical protein